MKKIILCVLALTFLLCACATPANTASQSDVSSAASETPAEIKVTANTAVTDGIGKALTDLKAENATYDYLELSGPDCYYGGLSKADKSFAYLFFGAQDGLTMAQAAEKQGEQLHCSGIYTTVGDYFSGVDSASLSVDEFIAAIDLKDEDVSYWFGWVSFIYNGYAFDIDTGDGNADDIDAKPAVKISAAMPLIIRDRMAMEMNGNILHY